MSLSDYIASKKKSRGLLLMTHTVVGYPSLDANWQMLEGMQAAGVDLVELQMPFSEPIADGPAFNRANQAALANGVHWDDYFALMTRAAKAFSFRLLFMGYYNNVFRLGHETFCRRLAEAGGHGFIIADLPPDQCAELNECARKYKLDPIHMMTPLNEPKRLKEIARDAAGFIYCVARKGVTGRATAMDAGLKDYIARCRAATKLPLGMGFGIRTPDDVRQLKGLVDLAIVGTACLDVWERDGRDGYLKFLQSLMDATR
ncbi:MAG: tryptophan synthase subunit alpha [Gammaproteobacteria bacterium RIFCSPLOWO2_02_FULL_61_13]|nr:MAG: tryptophan synthase subunit alpha [Gammaproteobacteria bacterium RIFCSPLOWO2_02_FULL_61_13]